MGKNKTYITTFPVTITLEKNGLYVIGSPILDIVTQGTTVQEAKQNFAELVEIFFQEIAKKNTTNKVLESLGWSKQKGSWKPPEFVGSSFQSVPLRESIFVD